MTFIEVFRGYKKWLDTTTHDIRDFRVVFEFSRSSDRDKYGLQIAREFMELRPLDRDVISPIYAGSIYGIPFELILKD